MKKIKIELTPAEVKLLVHYLHAHYELRQDDCCNDLCGDEIEDIGLTQEEWSPLLTEIAQYNPERNDEPYESVGEMSAPEPINYIYYRIVDQLKKTKSARG